MSLRLSVLSLTFIAAALACSPYRSIDTNPTNVRRAIDRENAFFIAAMARADAAAVAATSHFLHEVGPVQVTIETAKVWVADALAYESGKWTYTFTQAGAGTRVAQTIGGRYVTVWKPQADGGWKVMTDLSIPGTELRP